MVSGTANLSPASPPRTVWGLDPVQLHTRYWASLGVQVVRQGEPSEVVPHAELYLLTDPRSLPIFKMSQVLDVLNWVNPQVLFVRLHDTRERNYRERVVTDSGDRFVRFQRIYESADRLARVVLTSDREIAQLWQKSPDPVTGWRRLRRFVKRYERMTLSINGTVHDRSSNDEIAGFMSALVKAWRRPDSVVARAKQRKTEAGVWLDRDSQVDAKARLIGNVWIGAGRSLPADTIIVGPAIVWDDPEHRPEVEGLEWLQIEPIETLDETTQPTTAKRNLALKRLFDICFSLSALLVTAPLYPILMLLIWLQDGRPFFFIHTRESLNGREFGCLKFRSMRKNAEHLVKELKEKNLSDGAHVYIKNDPRVTPIGKFLRKSNLDELPQFWNVLMGDMSIVGPRPSPHKENQFAPAWREARLSVKPGITGLWQISRTRRAGSDFQEWIRYDLEYVEKQSFLLDLKIIWKTVDMIVRKGTNS